MRLTGRASGSGMLSGLGDFLVSGTCGKSRGRIFMGEPRAFRQKQGAGRLFPTTDEGAV